MSHPAPSRSPLTLKLAALCASLAVGGALTTGCASAAAPVNGAWYSSVKGPVEAGADVDRSKATKVGEAQAMSILGLIALGDCSIEKAAENGDITKISHVDHQSFSVLGIYATYTTIVHGE